MELFLYALFNLMGSLFWLIEKLVFCYFAVLVITMICITVGLIGLGVVITRWIFT